MRIWIVYVIFIIKIVIIMTIIISIIIIFYRLNVFIRDNYYTFYFIFLSCLSSAVRNLHFCYLRSVIYTIE